MRFLSNQNIVNIWERGFDQHPLDRALTLLSLAFPEHTWDHLATLPIYRRDALLFSVYEKVFGPTIQGFEVCAQCRERLEFSLPVKNFLSEPEEGRAIDALYLDGIEEGERLMFRFPSSMDLADVAGCTDIQSARMRLATRCVIRVEKNGVPVPDAALSPEMVDRLSERMESFPSTEIFLKLNCPACGNSWNLLLDISTFLWSKISSRARRILREVSMLARAYGWPEADILSMSPLRRQFYLEMAN